MLPTYLLGHQCYIFNYIFNSQFDSFQLHWIYLDIRFTFCLTVAQDDDQPTCLCKLHQTTCCDHAHVTFLC